jgi:hypothetical protein
MGYDGRKLVVVFAPPKRKSRSQSEGRKETAMSRRFRSKPSSLPFATARYLDTDHYLFKGLERKFGDKPPQMLRLTLDTDG